MDTHPTPRHGVALPVRPVPSRASAVAAGCFLALVPVPARADLLTGGLLGSVFRNEDFTGPRLIDLAVLGLVLFLVFRVLLGRPKKTGQQPTAPPPTAPPPTAPRDDASPYDDAPPPLDSPPGKPNMYTNAQATWAALKSPPPKGAPADTAGPLPADATPDQEFLAGAKLAYGRIVQAVAKRDFDDLAAFTTPLFLAQLKNSLPLSPPPAPDILLVEATLAGERQESGRTVMDVDYQVLIHEQDAPHNTDRLERWRFVRDTATPNAHWLLDAMERR